MNIEQLKDLDFVKELEAEGFNIFFQKIESLRIIHYVLKKGNITSTINEFHYDFVGIEALKQGLEMQKQAILSLKLK